MPTPTAPPARAARGAWLSDLLALTKPRITRMVVLTAAGGLWLAPGPVGSVRAAWALVGTALVVSSASTLNCWLEQDVDRSMTRTVVRPLPAGRVTPRAALGLGLVLGGVGLPILALLVNPLTALLGALALVTYVGIYTPMKRMSPKALLVGAIPGAMPPLMGWTAATGELGAPGLALFGILFLWQLPHFLAIAVFRQDEYAKAGIRVLPSVRGNNVSKIHALAYAMALIPMTLVLAPLGIAGGLYFGVMLIAGITFAGTCAVGLMAGPMDRAQDDRWARRVFVASLVYLPLLLATLALDVAT